MQVIQGERGGLIKAWTDGVPVEAQARAQLDNIAAMPFIHKHVAIMPDVHWGMGATVGSVIPTKGAIIPAAVGVDIGCGMMAHRTSLTASDLPDDLSGLRSEIEKAVPHGRTDNGGANDEGAWDEPSAAAVSRFAGMADELAQIVKRHPKIERAAGRAHKHIGTLGTGNHFIEICLDESDRVWIMLHSGRAAVVRRPRGAGQTS
jgi:tRNA-splicing ligase RtcB